MRKVQVRRDPAAKTWAVRRPGYGLRPDDHVQSGFPTQRAALRWADSTLHPHGTPGMYSERSDHIEDGISALPMWNPWWDEREE